MHLPWIYINVIFYIWKARIVHCTHVAQTSRPCVFEQHVILEQPLKILGKFVRLVVLFLRITILPLQQLKDTKGLVLPCPHWGQSVWVFQLSCDLSLRNYGHRTSKSKTACHLKAGQPLTLMTFSDGSGNVEPIYLQRYLNEPSRKGPYGVLLRHCWFFAMCSNLLQPQPWRVIK